MIAMHSIADLAAQNHSLGLYCIACDRWSTADLQSLIRTGRGDVHVTAARFRCRDCGGIADKLLRPPVPTLGGAAGYISLRRD
jgi:hypothetical protein